MWVEAIALVAIFFLDWLERRDARIERAEQRRVREEERIESEERRKAREEERQERLRAEGDRQRNNVTCLGVSILAETVTEDRLGNFLWQRTNKQPGFALQKLMHNQLPEYLLRISEPYSEEIRRATAGGNRYWLVFKFPFRHYGAVLSDLRILKFNADLLVAWDENGKPMALTKEEPA